MTDRPVWVPRVCAYSGLQKIPFVSVAEWEEWLERNHAESDGVCGQDGRK